MIICIYTQNHLHYFTFISAQKRCFIVTPANGLEKTIQTYLVIHRISKRRAILNTDYL